MTSGPVLWVKSLARSLRAGAVPRERFRLAHPNLSMANGVIFSGDPHRADIGSNVTIAGPTVINVANGGGLTGSHLQIGDRTYIGEFNNIRCAGAPIRIGADCLISQHITIVGTNHGIEPGTPIARQPWEGDGVVIGDDVWIGAGCVIVAGARIGSGSVVAANSVVRGVVEPGSIVAGAPAKLIRMR